VLRGIIRNDLAENSPTAGVSDGANPNCTSRDALQCSPSAPTSEHSAGPIAPAFPTKSIPLETEYRMIGVFVTFRYGDSFDAQTVLKIADAARAKFEGMPGLRSKAFTINGGKREATNFYIWDSEEAANGFFTASLLERVTRLYGVQPEVEFVQIASLVENVIA
jgi:hypothetical protein